jgi:hypothetical protein
MDANLSVGALWNALNDSRNRPAARVVIEAIFWDVRENGLAALKSESNKRRLVLCDENAKAEVKRRIASLQERGDVK